MELKQSAITGIRWSLVSTILKIVLDFFQLLIIARFLSPADFGAMAMAMVVIGFAFQYTDMGTGAALVQRDDISSVQIASLYWLNVFGGIACFLLVCGISPFMAAFFNEPLLTRILPILAIDFLIMAGGEQYCWLMEKNLLFDLFSKFEICGYIAEFIVTILCAFHGMGVWALVLGFLVGTGVRYLLIIILGWKHWPPMFHFSRKDLHCFRQFALFQIGERSILYANSSLDRILVGKLLGVQELGYYTFAFNRIIQSIYIINQILAKISFPLLARMQKDIIQMRQSYIKIINLISAVNAPLFCGLAVIAPTAIPLIFGRQWQPAASLVQLLAINSVIRSTNEPIYSLILAKGRADLSFKWNLFVIIVTLPTIVIGAKMHQSIGVAIALILLSVCFAAISYLYIVRQLIGTCSSEYFFSILKPALLALVMTLSAWVLSLFGNQSLIFLTIQITVGCLIYMHLLWLMDRSLYYELKRFLLPSFNLEKHSPYSE